MSIQNLILQYIVTRGWSFIPSNKNVIMSFCQLIQNISGFVCVEVLRPSEPSGVMSSAVSLPNPTFTGQA